MITINGKMYSGKTVSVQGNEVKVDGQVVEAKPDARGILGIEITGDPASIVADGSVQVTGQVGGSVQAGGSVHCGAVKGSVTAGGSAHCGPVGGAVTAGGSVISR